MPSAARRPHVLVAVVLAWLALTPGLHAEEDASPRNDCTAPAIWSASTARTMRPSSCTTRWPPIRRPAPRCAARRSAERPGATRVPVA